MLIEITENSLSPRSLEDKEGIQFQHQNCCVFSFMRVFHLIYGGVD